MNNEKYIKVDYFYMVDGPSLVCHSFCNVEFFGHWQNVQQLPMLVLCLSCLIPLAVPPLKFVTAV